MAWRFTGRARVNVRNPQAFAVCDRCGIWYNQRDLQWQFDFRGPNLQNLRILVCRHCLDLPQPQLKPRIIPADPLPIMNARPEGFSVDEQNWTVTQDGSYLITQTGLRQSPQNEANERLPPPEE